MRIDTVLAAVLTAVISAGCAFENTAKLANPAAPSGTSSTSGGGAAVSAFSGSWGSASLADLPVGDCTNLKWLITDQSATSLAGTLSATCAGGSTIAASLSGRLVGDSTINLSATGVVTALGIPCPFNLTGVGTRQANDSMKLDYEGTHCLGKASGSVTLRRFPDVS